MADYEFPLDFQELFYLHQDIEQNRPGFELLSAAGQGLGFHVQKQLSLLFQQPLHSVVPVEVLPYLSQQTGHLFRLLWQVSDSHDVVVDFPQQDALLFSHGHIVQLTGAF